MGRRFGRRMSPPAPATRPRLASGMPKVAWSAATTRSHDSMISQPPASAAPLTAAMIGLGNCRWVMPANPPVPPMMAPPSPEAKALRSMPAEKALSPAPVRTTTAQPASRLELVEGGRHPHADVAVDGVAGLGPVDREDLDVSSSLAFDCGHRCSFRCVGLPESDRACRARVWSPGRPNRPWARRRLRRQSVARRMPAHVDAGAHQVAPRQGGELIGVGGGGDLAAVGEPGDHRGGAHCGRRARSRPWPPPRRPGPPRRRWPPGRLRRRWPRCAVAGVAAAPSRGRGGGAVDADGVLGGVPPHGADQPGATAGRGGVRPWWPRRAGSSCCRVLRNRGALP